MLHANGDDEAPRCPHCARPLGALRYGQRFGRTAIRIIDAVEHAGECGIPTEELFKLIYAGVPNAKVTRLHSYIRTINMQLASTGVAIRNYDRTKRGGRYTLTGRRAA